jgi:hypothetical protein
VCHAAVQCSGEIAPLMVSDVVRYSFRSVPVIGAPNGGGVAPVSQPSVRVKVVLLVIATA